MDKVRRYFEEFEKYVLSIPFIFLSFAIVVNVICRKMFGFSYSWLEELSRYIFIFATFMGASIAITSDRHPKMTAIQSLVGKKGSKYLILASNAICMGLFIYVSYFAFKQVGNLIRSGAVTSSIGMPLYIAYIIIPLSMIGMIIRYCHQIVKNIKGLNGGDGA